MNINALKALYVALGGNLANTYSDIADGIAVADYVLLADVISAIAKIAGGSIELPAVSSTDNGDVLTVVNGAWNKAKAPEGLPTGTTGGEMLFGIPHDEGWHSAKFLPTPFDGLSSSDDQHALIYDNSAKKVVINQKLITFFNFECEYDTSTSKITAINEAEKTPAEIDGMYFTNGNPRNTIIFAKIMLVDTGSFVGVEVLPINISEDGFTIGTSISGGYSDTTWTVSSN